MDGYFLFKVNLLSFYRIRLTNSALSVSLAHVFTFTCMQHSHKLPDSVLLVQRGSFLTLKTMSDAVCDSQLNLKVFAQENQYVVEMT